MEVNLDKLDLYVWAKDKTFKFTSCSENLVQLAGENSPHSLSGKDDYSLIWRKDADFFRSTDMQIMAGQLRSLNSLEIIDTIQDGIIKKQKILITKIPLINAKGEIIGIIGSHINISSLQQTPSNKYFDAKGRFLLPKKMGNEYLTVKEFSVLRLILMGKTSKEIAKFLGLSYRTIEGYTDRIKRKLQCSKKYQIHAAAVELGISHMI